MHASRALAPLALLALAGCSGRQATSVDDATARDTRVAGDAPPNGDGVPGAPDRGPVDLSNADAGCACPADRVLYHGTCVPTRQLGNCTPPCDPADLASCGADERCDPWGAVTPDPGCRITAAALPACVPRSPAAAGDLRISPTTGNAAALATLTIEGGELTLGALMWLARMGDGKPVEVGPPGGGACRHEVDLMPPRPGIWPVEVYYGTPSAPTGAVLLAGFYVASGGAVDEPTAQPGERCSAALPCAQAAPYTCGCTSGRCVCAK